MYTWAKRRLRRAGAALVHDRCSLSIFLFHSLFADDEEARAGHLAPQQAITVADFRSFVEHYRRHGYRFVGATDVMRGLAADQRYVMVTFDDGYANNLRALPILRENGVPAVFFIATQPVESGHCFWWDVLFRERSRQGRSREDVRAEGRELKRLATPAILERLEAELGAAAFAPRGDADRPMNVAELQELAREPGVELGNHTLDHAILPNQDDEELHRQLAGCQDALERLTGRRPRAIAYPGGDHSPRVLAACSDVGLELGITVKRKKNYPPFPTRGAALLTLNRFTLWGDRSIEGQCAALRSDFSWQGLQAGRARPADA